MLDFNETAGGALPRVPPRAVRHFPAALLLVCLALIALTRPACAAESGSPVLTAAPGKWTAFEGDSHDFTVVATGTDPLSYQWRRDGANLPGKTNTSLSLLVIQTNDAGFYSVVVTNIAGSVTSAPVRLTVRTASDARYPPPQGGWAYLFDGNSAASSLTASLDGTWNHNNGLDSWDGFGRGAGNGLPGGIDTTNGILTIEDAIVANGSGFDNRRYYLTRDLNQDARVTNANTLLNDGVTLTFRARLTPPTDPLIELTNAPNGWVNTNDGKGMFGIRQSGSSGMLISFSLNRAVEDIGTNTTFSFPQAGLHMNNLNGNSRSSFVDPGEAGTLSLLPLDPTIFHEFWITIRDNGAAPGTHVVTLYLDGARTGAVFNVTAGIGSDIDTTQTITNYLALGLGSAPERGAVDIDFFGYAPGVLPPTAFNEPVGFTLLPTNVTLSLGEVTTFNVGVTGTPPQALQWFKNGAPIANATNAGYTTPPMTAGDDGTLFTVIVTNEVNSITSSPPTVLFLLKPPTITGQPQNLVVTNGDAATFSVAFFSPQTTLAQWRFNGSNIAAETNTTLALAITSPASAGNYDVVLTNSGGATTSAVAVLTVRVLDFGDAPSPPYPTLKAGNGARHVIVPGVYLGAGVDMELDAHPDASATGDDLDGTDDEDGVNFRTPLRAGQPATVEIVASTNGILNAWIDFNASGGWAQAGEQVFTNVALVAGTNTLAFLVPPAASPGNTFARFRFNTAGGLSFDGPAADGEVEDHQVAITPVADVVVSQRDTPDPAGTGSNVTYSITVSNAGPSAASAISFTNTLPAGIVLVSATPSQGSCTPGAGRVTCSLNGLAPGAAATVTLLVTATAEGTLTNLASAFASELDLSSANNSAAETTTVLAPPQITTQPQSLTVTNGGGATFNVSAAGAPPLRYQWRRNGADLPGETNFTLAIPNAQPASAGSYTVRVTNSVGAIDSQPAVFTVLVPPAITTPPQSRTNLAGGTATFSVTATGTDPLLYQWFFNGTNTLAGATSATLSLNNVQTTQAGAYHVRVSNSAGVATSAPATLTVIEMDFGDAPDPTYPTSLANNGARHRLVAGLHLGLLIDFEPDGQPNSTATGDNLSGGNDEDGVTFLSPVLVGQVVNVSVVASANGRLDAWLDFNRSGGWADAGEQIFTNTPLVAGTNLLSLRVPFNASPGAAFARFRFSTAGGLSFTGEAMDGEVEDYAVPIGGAVDLIATTPGSSAPITAGSNVTFVLNVTNTGPSSATGVALVETLPAGLAYVSATGSQGGCVHAAGVITCALGTLASNAVATVTIETTAIDAGALTNSAEASANETDLNPANNTVSFIVNSFFPPEIITQPASRTVTNGDAASFSITANGTALRYQWLKDGAGLAGATNATLLIPTTQTNHAGAYRVRVMNEVGLVFSAPATLTVLVPAMILVQPQSVDRIVGQSAVFAVAASGTGPLGFQWQFESQDLPDETNATLTLGNVQASQAGLYRVLVSNTIRTVLSDAARLTVFVPPAFTTQPQSRTNLAGSSATLLVAATGSAPLHYQWYFNGSTPLDGATEPMLALTNLQPSQAGGYTVVVTNLGGVVTSAVAVLTLIETDFGDAPQALGYPTVLSFNGARHRIVPGVRLGSAIDFEPDGQPDPNATGDDLAGAGDEDGVLFTTLLLLDHPATIAVTASTSGFIDAWIDFNANGSWLESGEQIFTSSPVTAGVNLLTFTVPPDAALTNTFARFRFSTAGGLPSDGPAADGEVEDYAVTILPSFDLGVTLIDLTDPVVVTSNVLFTITVTNRGPSFAADVMLTNALPAGMIFLSANATQGSCTNQAGRLVCMLGALPANTGARVIVQLLTQRPGRFASSAVVAASGNDVDLANNTTTQSTAVVVAPVSFAEPTPIPVTDAGESSPGLGSPYPSTIAVSGLTGAVYKVTVTLNNLTHTFPGDLDILLVGPSGQKVVLMSDAGAGIGIQDSTVTFDDDAGISLPNSGFITSTAYRPTNLGAEPDVFPVPAPPGPYAAALSAFRGTDPNGVWSLYVADDAANDVGAIGGGWQIAISTADPIADLAVGVSSPLNPIAVLSNVTYTVTVTNLGLAAATGVRLLDPLPAGTSFVSASLPGGSCGLAGGAIQCDIANLNPGATAVATILLQAILPGPLTNSVSVTGAQLDFVSSNNTASAVTTVLPLNNLVLIHRASTNRVVLGEQITYALAVTNLGPAPAAHVVLVDALPDGVSFIGVSSAAACTRLGSLVSCDFGTLGPGAGGTVQVLIQPLAPGFATNSASVAADEIDSAASDNFSQIVTPVNVRAELALAVAITPNPVAVTSNLVCTIQVTNAGPSAALGVQLTSPLPAGVTFVSGISTLGNCANDAGTIHCALGNMAPGQDAVILLFVTPQAVGSLQQQFQLGSESFDFTPADNAAQTVTAVEQGPILAAGPASQTVLNGASVTFTVTAAGLEPLHYQWQVNGGDIANATNAALVLSGVTPAVQGTYRVRVGNLVGTVVSTAAVLRVLVPPQITDVTNVTVDEDQPTPVLEFTVADFETPAGALVVTATSSNLQLVPPANILLGGAGSNRTVQVLPATNQSGSTLITLQVRDADDVTATDSFLVTVLPINDPPFLSAIGDRTTPEDTALAIALTLGDVETDIEALIVKATSTDPILLPPGALILAHSGPDYVLTVRPATNQSGAATITLNVTDTDGASTSNSFTLTVAAVNDPPTLNPIANVDVDEDSGLQTVALTGLSSGATNEFQTLTVTATSGSPSILPGPFVAYTNGSPTGVLTFTPQPNQNGDVAITVQVDDGGNSNNTITRVFTMHVHAVNDPPTLSDIASQATEEDTALTVSFSVDDVDTGAAGLTLTATSSDTNLVPIANITFSGTGATRQVQLLPATNQSGSATLTVTVRDPGGATASDSFLLVVTPVNDPPTLAPIADVEVAKDTGPHTVPLNGITAGAANEIQPLSVTALSSNPAFISPSVSYVSRSAFGSLTFTTPPGSTGSVMITVTVDDGAPNHNTASRSFTLNVIAFDHPPTLSEFAGVTTREDEPVSVPFSVNDEETPLAALLLAVSSSDTNLIPSSGLSVSGAGAVRLLRLAPAANRSGSATITVSVTDTNGGSVSRSFPFTVTPVNDPPRLSGLATLAMLEDTPMTLTGITVSDVESDPAAITLIARSSNTNLIPEGNMTIAGSGSNRSLTITPSPNQSGTALITVTATDPDAGAASGTFTVTVAAVNDPPTLTTISNVTVTEDSGTRTVALSGISAGPANEPQLLSFTATTSDPALLNALAVSYVHPQSTGLLSFATAPNANGTATITVMLDDGAPSNNIVSQTFTVTVTPLNDPPVISEIEPQSTPEDTARVIAFTVGDDTTPAANLGLSAASSDTNVVPLAGISFGGSGTNRTVTVLPATNAFGAATITITATDINNATAIRPFVLTVNPVNDPPTLSNLPDQTVSSATNLVTLNFTVGDLETAPSALSLAGTSANPSFLANTNLAFGGSGSNRTLLVTLPSAQSGSATLTVSVKDAGGLAASRSFLLTVNLPNQPPTISVPGNQIADEDTVASLAVVVGDAETPAGNLTLTASSSNTSLVTTNGIALGGAGAIRLVTLTPVQNQTGAALITLIVSDAAGARTTNSFQVTFQPVNDVPTLNPISNLATNKNPGPIAIGLAGITAGGGETQPLIVTAVSGTPALIPNPGVNYISPGATGSLTLNPISNAVGTATITVRVDDGAPSNNIVARSFTVTLNPSSPTNAPTISSIPSQQVNEDTPLTLSFTINDTDTPSVALALSGSSTNASLVANTNIFFDGSDTNRTVTIVPSPNQFGVTLITLRVTDGTTTNSASFLFTVNAVNDPPTLNRIPDGGVLMNKHLILPLTGITSGASNEAQTLTVTGSVANTALIKTATVTYSSPATNGTIDLLAAGNVSGATTVTVTVKDGQATNNLFSRTFTVRVYDSRVNSAAPTLSAITNRVTSEDIPTPPIAFTVGDSQTPASLLTVGGQSSNTNLVRDSNIVFGGSGSARTVTVTPASNQFGTCTITVSVLDTNSGYNWTNFQLTVNPVNDAPQISSISNQTVAEDTVIGPLSFNVSDAETPADRLVVTAVSENLALVPAANILLGGNGTNRAIQITPATNQSGTATLTLRVTDGAATNTSTFTVTVNAANDPPTLTDIADQTINQDTATAPLAFTVGDAETAPASLTLSSASSNPALVPTNAIVFGGSGAARTVTVTPAPNRTGTALLTITVSDGAATSSDTLLLTVNATGTTSNAPPTLDAIADRSLNQNAGLQTVNLTGVGSGSTNENQPLTLAAASGNPALIPNPVVTYSSPATTGTLKFTPLPGASGTATISVFLSDGQAQNNLATRTFTVTVNAAPALSQVADQLIDEDSPTAAIPVTVGDAETPAASLTLTASAADSNLVASITFGGSGSNRTVTVTPLPNQSGHSLITITVTDGDSNAAGGSFELIVNPVNDAPTLATIGDITVGEDSGPRTVNLAGISSGAANEVQTLFVTATSSRPGLIPNPSVSYTSPGATGTLTFAPAPNSNGVATISVIVRDGQTQNGSVTQSFAVTVTATNDLPTISDVPDQLTQEDTPLTVGCTVGDIETAAGALTLSASSSDTNLVPLAGIVFAGAGVSRAAVITPGPNRSGSATLTFTVSDGAGGSASDSFVLTVGAVNDPPSISDIADQTIPENSATTLLAFTVGDPETAASALTLDAVSSDTSLVPATGIVFGGGESNRTVTVTPAANRSGSVTITVRVSDGNGATAADSFVLTVNPVNHAPTISDVPNLAIEENTSTAVIGFVVGDPETPAANLNLSASSSNPTLVPDRAIVFGGGGSNRTVVVTPASNRSGTAILTLTVTDGSGASASDTFVLTVNPPFQPPGIIGDPVSQLAALGGTVNFSVITTGTAPLQFQWQRDGIDLPGETNAVLTMANVQADGAGEYRVRVSNAAGWVLSATATLRVVAAPVITGFRRVGATIEVSFTTVPNFTYTVEFKNEVSDPVWSSIAGGIGTGSITTVIDQTGIVLRRLYRVRVN